MSKTKKPKGLNIARNGSSYNCSWKKGDNDYGNGQQFEWRLSGEKSWRKVSIGASTTAKSISVASLLSSLYPSKNKTVSSITFRVRGNRKKYTTGSGKKKKSHNPTWSDWEDKSFSIKIPAKPSISAALSETYSNVTTFSFNVAASGSAYEFFRDIEFQSILVKECNETNGAKLSWKTSALGWMAGTSGASGSRTVTEDTELLANGSYTRWFRVRSRGPAGASDWAYAKHVYAQPYTATIKSAVATAKSPSLYLCTVTWEAGQNASHPNNETSVQYAIATPAAGMACPSGASWEDADTSADTAGKDKAVFYIDSGIGLDECLFVRVNTKHDSKISYGSPAIAAVGALENPSSLSVSTDDATHRATITATNNSDVPDSFLAIEYRVASKPNESYICGIIPHGSNSVTVQCPDWSQESGKAFGVRAVVGSYAQATRADGASCYTVTEKMKSETIWDGGSVPSAPTGVVASQTDTAGTIRVKWNWAWDEANSAELSWANHEDAWESTDEPSTFEIDDIHAAQWNISGLETGKKWYVRVRLLKTSTDDAKTYGPYSETIEVDLSSAPAVPVLQLSQSTITPDGSTIASWVYSTTDGTEQAYAEICEAEVSSSGVIYGEVIAHTESAQSITLSAKEKGWLPGYSYGLAVRVVSASGKVSDSWSDPVFVSVAEPLIAVIASTSLQEKTVPADEEKQTTRTVLSLTEMPLTATVTGAGAGGETILSIERAEDYRMLRPDESKMDGHKGEIVAEVVQSGEETITIDRDDLRGLFDDGAQYLMRATVKDGLGQSAEATLEFEVHWDHQAIMPKASVRVDNAEYISIITPIAPEGAAEGDTVDIYRLSADLPELIIEDGQFGTAYVDPFPAIGEHGGHRVVFKTANGDYITEDQRLAWIDLGYDDYDELETEYNIIDFDDEQILFQYNVDISNTWEKDFKRTAYLGGSVQGDWNPAVNRDSSIDTVVMVEADSDTIKAMRRLAEYPGICHIRTKDGSSFAADIQVKEGIKYSEAHKLASYSLSIMRVDPEKLDGVTYQEWKG